MRRCACWVRRSNAPCIWPKKFSRRRFDVAQRGQKVDLFKFCGVKNGEIVEPTFEHKVASAAEVVKSMLKEKFENVIFLIEPVKRLDL